jgi:hypothetical protein
MKKKINLILCFLIVAGSISGQQLNPYPIPSYDVPVDSTSACFTETAQAMRSGESLEKRQVHVVIVSNGAENPPCEATVWIYSIDGLDVLGPFIVACGGHLDVPIDDREWGVYVVTDDEILVDVWITEE